MLISAIFIFTFFLSLILSVNTFLSNRNYDGIICHNHHRKQSIYYKKKQYRSLLSIGNSVSNIFGERRLSNTEVLDDAARHLKVSPPWNAPKWIWSKAWKLHAFLLPILHWFDKCTLKDNCVNLAVLWWKAIAGNRWGSQSYDKGIAFDFLPNITRRIIMFPLCWLYPNLHHQNVLLRTIFLDKKVKKLINKCIKKDKIAPNIIILGGGFDTRSIRLSMKYDEIYNNSNYLPNFYELDLPEVIKQKKCIFSRFLLRSKNYKKKYLPKLISIDLNNLSLVQNHIENLLKESSLIDRKKKKYRSTIFIAEAILLYLEKEKILPLLQICGSTAAAAAATAAAAPTAAAATTSMNSSVWFVFADRIPYVMMDRWRSNSNMNNSMMTNMKQIKPVITNPMTLEEEHNRVSNILLTINWKLLSCISKPGLARHMGHAQYHL